MKTHPLPFISRIGAFGRLLIVALGVWLVGVAYAPPVMAATTPVSVSQSPLSLQPTIPPNVVLMLDDSGSMAWDYMPDACYLYGVTCGQTPSYYGGGCQNGNSPINNTGSGTGQCVDTISTDGNGNYLINNTAVIDASNNGVYYNPTVVYTPPPTATGGTYTSQTNFTNVPVDGFGVVGGTANLTNYSNNDMTGEDDIDNGTLYYSTTAPYTANQNYNAQASSSAACNTAYVTTTGGQTGWSSSYYTPNTGKNATGGTCAFTYSTTSTYYYFQYAVGPAAGPYVIHYVAPASQGCGSLSNCVVDSDTTGTAAPAKDASGNALAAGTNVANWFAYYHTRIQMAKSGLMTAFSTVDQSFRIGFGSIDNNGSSKITSLGNSLYKKFNSQYIAYVQPFGNGSSGTQKANFWNWAASINPNNGTPLRLALDSVGKYYQTTQPWTTMSSDPGYGSANQPSNIACRQAYTILTTDGFWNESNPPSATGEQGASNLAWPSISGPNGLAWPTTAGSLPGVPYSGGLTGDGSSSLADVALYYWENDLQSSKVGTNIPNEVPTSTADPAFWQHMTTFTMGLGFTPTGITGTASNGDSPPSVSDVFNAANGSVTLSNFSWPTPAANSIYNISDLEHAGVNGHGGFYSATNPATFTGGLRDAFRRATSRVGTGASLAANSTQLTNGTVAYQATYYTSVWTGDLNALAINSSTGAIATTPTWSATKMLPTAANRNIITYNPSAAAGSQFVAFQVNATTGALPSLSTEQVAALGGSTTEAAIINYLRGDHSQEQNKGGSYRNRKTPLGDIVDSQPVYSGAPNTNEFGGETFTGITNTATSGDNSFQGFAGGTTDSSGNFTPSTASQRETLVFVAGNDGMLHAFDAGTGTEKYAYLPGAVITGDNTTTTIDGTALATLANTNYGSTTGTTPHQFYNDGELTIADVFDGSNWRTVLVGTTGRGPAEAVYALDVTNPASITPLWERSAYDGKTNSNYIGQMVGKPVIAKVQDGTTSDWQVLIGNGYNSASGQAALLEFDVLTGTLSVHTTTNRSGYTSAGNGLAAPVAWMDSPATGVSDVAYAGDVQGQVWRFPLSTSKTTGQGTTYTTDPSTLGGSASDGFVVFTTQLTSNGTTTVPQPITGGMLAGSDPTTSNVWLFFGTGEYLNNNDLTNMQVQSWYGVVAEPGGSFATSALTYSNLVQRSITYEADGDPSAVPPTLGVRTVTTNVDSNGGAIPSGDSGWYINLQAPTGTNGALVNQGERMVTPNQFQGNLLLATTRIPIVTDICNPSGSGWVMAVNPFTGTNPTTGFYQVNGNTTVSITVGGKLETVPVAGVGFSSLPNNPIFVGGDMLMSFDNGSTSNVQTTGTTGGVSRVSWQELVNP